MTRASARVNSKNVIFAFRQLEKETGYVQPITTLSSLSLFAVLCVSSWQSYEHLVGLMISVEQRYSLGLGGYSTTLSANTKSQMSPKNDMTIMPNTRLKSHEH